MNIRFKIPYLPVLFILLFLLSSCSVLRGRKCDCPQWSMENSDGDSERYYSDEFTI